MKKKILLYILIFIFFIFPFKSVYAEEYFWRIGSSEYSKFSTALTHVNDNEQTTIVLINGGNLKVTVPVGEGNPQNNPQDAIDQVSITIKKGDFESTGDKVIDAENPETIIQLVTGGTYTYDPSEYVQD